MKQFRSVDNTTKPLRLIVILLWGLVYLHLSSVAQPVKKLLAFNALTINDGLSQGMVTSIFQDRFGFMWFATLDGLNRYDGYRFIIYRHDAKDSCSIAEGFVSTFFEDSQGRLWVATIKGGLEIYDRKTETFVHVNNQRDALLESPIKTIAEDKLGNIWIHSYAGLSKISINKNGQSPASSFSIRQVNVPFHAPANILTGTKKRDLYYTDAAAGLIYKLDDAAKEKWSAFFDLGKRFIQADSAGRSSLPIAELLEDPAAEKIYAFREDGAIKLDEKTGRREAILRNVHYMKGTGPVHAVLDSNGIIWFSGKDGFSFFDPRTGKLLQAVANEPTASRTLKTIYCTYVDRSGLLWIGSAGYGILKRNVLADAFHHTTTLYTYSIKDEGNQIIFGNSLSTQVIFDRQTETLTDNKKQSVDTSHYFSPIASDKRGQWFTGFQGVRFVDKVSRQITNYSLPVTQSIGIDFSLQHSLLDSGGNVWFCTSEGLLRFSLATKKWTPYQSRPNDPTSLSSNVIFSLCIDPFAPKKYLWVGTGGNGLNRLDMTTGKCRFYSTKDGLPNNVIYSIVPDDGNLWMSTNKGLSCFNLQKQTFRNFDYKDGLQSNEFNRSACLKTKDGCLFFGGVNGVNYFYPREVLKTGTVPQVEITGLKIRNQPVGVESQNAPLKTAVYLAKELTLPYKENIVSFEFASMDYTNPEKNQYRYKLEGFDKEWINAGTINNATYTNLDPGTYTFTVKGSNSSGTWNDAGTSIQLVILPPWYMTWWFRTLVVLAVVAAGYAFYRYRLAQALKLQAIRNRIAGDLHDEVGSNLSNIYIFSNVAQQRAMAGDKTELLLQKINDYTQQSMEAMSDIVWMINTRNDRFENIMVRIRILAAEFTETSGCALHLDLDERLNDVKLNMEARKNFYLIYKEAINNVAKHAGCKNLRVCLKLQQNTVLLEISDDGRGFEPTNILKGNGILNMTSRAKLLKGALAVASSTGEGTTLTLRFKV